MQIYILRPVLGDELWNPWYDKTFGFVIRAESVEKARELAASDVGDEGEEAWLDAIHSTCEILLAEGEEEIIIHDFLEHKPS